MKSSVIRFPLVLLQAKVVGFFLYTDKLNDSCVSISSPSSEGGGTLPRSSPAKSGQRSLFPLVLLQAKVVGNTFEQEEYSGVKFPLVLLQAKVVGGRRAGNK